MESPLKKTILIAVIVFVVGLGLFFGLHKKQKEPMPIISAPEPIENAVVSKPKVKYQTIGTSVKGRRIEAYTYGNGDTHVVFAGGMHGGYEWNSVLLAYQLMDYLESNPDSIPENLSVTVIPAINPDGVHMVTNKEGRFTIGDVSTDKQVLASGRFNADGVDLNRNFDCKWQPTSKWQDKTVSAGTAPFSEPEALALENFVLKNKIAAVIFWHSQANGVYASACEGDILPTTSAIVTAYSQASGYPQAPSFDSYEITGDSGDWLASIGVPALTVELETHTSIEWDKNLAGIKAILKYFN